MVDDLDTTVERLYNAEWKNNIKIRGLKEGVEGSDLVGFLTGLFTSWAGAKSKISITVTPAYQIGTYKISAKYSRDIIVQFSFWITKSKILESFGGQPYLVTEGRVVKIISDLSIIT